MKTATGHRAAPALLALAVAGLLGACSILGTGDRETATIFAPDPRVAADASWPVAHWQLTLSPPTAPRAIDTFRMMVRPVPGELQVYRGASWARTPTDMLQDTLLRTLEDSGRIDAVARQGAGVAADYKLVLDLRRFEADYAGGTLPSATIEVNAKLLHGIDQKIVASRTFLHAEQAAATDVQTVADAFSTSLGRVSGDMAAWILQTGNAHEATHPSPARR